MQAETFSKDVRRQRCGHEPTVIELTIGKEPYSLRVCSWCDWTQWAKGDDAVDLTDVLARLAAAR